MIKNNLLNFQTENLVIDYISFNITGSDNTESIAKYLFEKFNFNSTFAKGQNGTSKYWFYLPVNQHQVSFRQLEYDPLSKSFWEGTVLHFSGYNASVFYSLVQKQLIDWTIFSSGVLNRFDLYYSRTNKISRKDFLENCQRKLKQTNKNTSLEKNRKGWILKIGSRRSNNYSRIYETKNSLKFEHEMKGRFLQKYYALLVHNRL
jgi:hypothetical protein